MGEFVIRLEIGKTPLNLLFLLTTKRLSVKSGIEFFILKYLRTNSIEWYGLTTITSVFIKPPAESSGNFKTCSKILLFWSEIFSKTSFITFLGKSWRISATSSGSRSFVTSATSAGSIKDKIISLTSSDKFFKISPSFFSSINCQIKALVFGGLDSINNEIS